MAGDEWHGAEDALQSVDAKPKVTKALLDLLNGATVAGVALVWADGRPFSLLSDKAAPYMQDRLFIEL